MKELDRKDTPEVTGGTVGPVHIPIVRLPLPGPEFPPSPLGAPEPPAVEKYLT